MTAATTLERLTGRVVAVLRAASAEGATTASEALIEAGVTAVEITYTTPGAAEAIRALRGRHDDGVLIGAGTLRTAWQCREAARAGADFLVTPHLDEPLLAEMLATGLLALPGVLTPSEAARAVAGGAPAVKLFPAATVGLGHLRALRGPFPELRVMPTGGIGADAVAEWLAAGALAVGAGGELTPSALLGDPVALTAHARDFLRRAGVTA